jgi:hypothetical protein
MTWQTTLEIATPGRGTRDISAAVAEAVDLWEHRTAPQRRYVVVTVLGS